MVGGYEDNGGGRWACCNRNEIMQLEGLINGGEGVEAICSKGTDGEAEIFWNRSEREWASGSLGDRADFVCI